MNPDPGDSKWARQAANRKAHPVWRGIFIYSLACNLTTDITLFLPGRQLLHDTYPLLSDFVGYVYLISEFILLFVSPFFILRFGGIATFGLIVALLNFSLVFSISGRT
jgi:hypothetical protein